MQIIRHQKDLLSSKKLYKKQEVIQILDKLHLLEKISLNLKVEIRE